MNQNRYLRNPVVWAGIAAGLLLTLQGAVAGGGGTIQQVPTHPMSGMRPSPATPCIAGFNKVPHSNHVSYTCVSAAIYCPKGQEGFVVDAQGVNGNHFEYSCISPLDVK